MCICTIYINIYISRAKLCLNSWEKPFEEMDRQFQCREVFTVVQRVYTAVRVT